MQHEGISIQHKCSWSFLIIPLPLICIIHWEDVSEPLNQNHVGLYWCAAAILVAMEGMKDTETQGAEGTGHHSLTSLKSISWQLAGGTTAICNHQGPPTTSLTFSKMLSQSASPPSWSERTRVFTDWATWSAERRHDSGRAGNVRAQ